jgi:hypothetical protein
MLCVDVGHCFARSYSAWSLCGLDVLTNCHRCASVNRLGWALTISGPLPWWIGAAVEVALQKANGRDAARALLETSSSIVVGFFVGANVMLSVVMRS